MAVAGRAPVFSADYFFSFPVPRDRERPLNGRSLEPRSDSSTMLHDGVSRAIALLGLGILSGGTSSASPRRPTMISRRFPMVGLL